MGKFSKFVEVLDPRKKKKKQVIRKEKKQRLVIEEKIDLKECLDDKKKKRAKCY